MKPEDPTHRRAIRSFVKRTGRLTASQEKALEHLWPVWGIEYQAAPLDLDECFGRAAARVLEIGFGNGDSLVEMAAARPETDFLGIEVHEPGVGHCLIRIDEAGTTNLRLVMHDALDVLEDQLETASLDRINLYFPDPWPKTPKPQNPKTPIFLVIIELYFDKCIKWMKKVWTKAKLKKLHT